MFDVDWRRARRGPIGWAPRAIRGGPTRPNCLHARQACRGKRLKAAQTDLNRQMHMVRDDRPSRVRPSTQWLISLSVGLALGLCAAYSGADVHTDDKIVSSPAVHPYQLNPDLSLAESTAFVLRIDSKPGAPLNVSVPIAGTVQSLELAPYSVRAPDYELWVQQPDGSYVVTRPSPVRTLRGRVAEVDGSSVAASLRDERLFARIILPDGANWWVEPMVSNVASAEPGEHLVYRDDDVLPSGGTCIALDPPGLVATRHQPKRSVPAEDVYIAELAIDTDFGYHQLFRNEPDPIAAVEASVEELINAVNIQYERDVGVTHVITAIVVRPTEDDPYIGLDPEDVLKQFRAHWFAEQSHIRRDLAQLFTTRDFGGNTIGIAWVGQVCGNYAYSVIQTTCCNTFACKTDLSAHEIGHNWDARHCGYDGPGDPDDCVPDCPGWTMNCTITCANRFHETLTQPDILAHRDTRTCLVQGDELRRIHVLTDMDTVIEGATQPFTAMADFRYSDDEDVTGEATWFVNRPQVGSVDANGVFTAGDVNGDTCVVVSASYTYRDVTRTGDQTIVVLDTDTSLSIVDSNPPDGAIDARQPSRPDGSETAGWDSLTITFDGDTCLMSAEDFDVVTENRLGPTATLLEVEYIPLRSVRLVLSGPIESGAWTTVTHLGSGATVRVGSLPGDVNGDGSTDLNDVVELIRDLEGQSETPLSAWQCDIDRSSKCTAADLLRLIDLLNGADGYVAWNGVSLP